MFIKQLLAAGLEVDEALYDGMMGFKKDSKRKFGARKEDTSGMYWYDKGEKKKEKEVVIIYAHPLMGPKPKEMASDDKWNER